MTRFQLLKATSMKMAVIWDVAPCSLIDIYQTTRRSFPEDSHLRSVQSSFILFCAFCLLSDGFLSLVCSSFSSRRSASAYHRLSFLYFYVSVSDDILFLLQRKELPCAWNLVRCASGCFPTLKLQLYFILRGDDWFLTPQLRCTLPIVWGVCN
jgi:hypothetical protein